MADRNYLSPNSYSPQGIRTPSYNSTSDGGPLSVSSETNTAAASRVASGIVSAASRRPSMMTADRRHSSLHSPSHARASSVNPDGFPVVDKKSKSEWQAEIKKRMWLFDSHNSRLQRRVALGADEMLKEKQRTREFNRARNATSNKLGKGKPAKSAKVTSSGLTARKLQGKDGDRDTDAEDEEVIDKPFASDSEGHITPDSADEREKDEDEELDEMDDEEELFALMHGGKAEDADFISSSQWGGGDGSPGGGAGRNAGHREVGMQSMYGSKADACVATIITTADLAKLIPMPDDALMLRASLGSLQKLERHASELLAHVQREISVQVEDAGVSYARQENKHRRMGQLGSASVHEFRNTAMSRAMQEAASREADFQSHSAGITDGMGGGQEAGVEANLTKFRYEDGGKLTIRPGTAYSDRREIQYGGSTAAGGADGHGPSMQPYYPPTSHHRPQTGMCHLGLSRTPFSGSTGYSLYDAKTKSKLNMLMNLGTDMSSRHALYDDINTSVEYFSPLRHTIGDMARKDAEAAERAFVEAQLAGGGPNNMQRFGVGGNGGSGTHGSGLPRHGGGSTSHQQQQPSYDQILGKTGGGR